MSKRRKKEPDPPIKSSGDALFLELMMQMLAFFILLTTMAIIVDEKRLAALGSLAGTFSALPQGANPTKGEGPGLPARSITHSSQAPKRTAKALTELARELGVEDSVHVLPLTKDEVRVRLNEAILFSPGAVELSGVAKDLLLRMARLLRRPEVIQVTIEGHTDAMPVSGLYANNWELSAARAMSVFRELARNGMPKGRMVVAGMGANHPVFDGNGEVLAMQSRRVELLVRFRPVTDKAKEMKSVDGGMLHRPATAAGK